MLLPAGAGQRTQRASARAGTLGVASSTLEQRADEHAGVIVQIDPSAREDVITLVSWSDGAALGQERPYPGPLDAERELKRRGEQQLSAAVEVWYASQRLARCQVPLGRAQRVELARHSGVRLCPGSFRVHVAAGSRALSLRTALLISARAQTWLEDSTGDGLPALDTEAELQPCAAELLSLRRALFG